MVIYSYTHVDLTNVEQNKVRDAFGRLRTSSPYTVFDCNFLTTRHNDRWTERITGDGVVNYSSGSAWVELESAANGSIIRQTRRYLQYQPGKSFLIYITGCLSEFAPLTNQTSRIGVYDDLDGFYFQFKDNVMSVVRRSNVTGTVIETVVDQSNWNINTFPDLDVTKRQIFIFEQEWLGVGAMTMFIVNEDRLFQPVHRFNHVNNGTTPYTNRASLPVRYEIINTSTNPMKLVQICTSVNSEGGYNLAGKIFTYPLINSKSISTETPVLAIRTAANRSRVGINPMSINALVISSRAPIVYRIYKFNAPVSATVLPGAVWNASENIESCAEFDESATSVDFAAGTYELLFSDYFSDIIGVTYGDLNKYVITGSDVDGNPDILVITMEKIDGGNAVDVALSLTYQEIE